MEALSCFLEHRVNKLMELYLAGNPNVPPVDLREVAEASGVLSIEEREMIPEAVMNPGPAGFRIYLQSNFIDLPKMRVRRRFSLAHEIAHTLFYEFRDGAMRPVRKAPRGDSLETACHQGARLLLVPQRSLTRELQRIKWPVGAEAVIELSRRFDVSVEVMLRRLHEVGAFKVAETALILVRRIETQDAFIVFAVYPPWLKALLPTPSRGRTFASWLRQRSPDYRADPGVVDAIFEKGLQVQTAFGSLKVSPFSVTRSQHIFEFRIEDPSAMRVVV